MNFYFEAVKVLDNLDAKRGSIKSIIGGLNEKDRKRTAALVIETLKYKVVLSTVIKETGLLREERKKITSMNLALVLVHDLLLGSGIQAGDGPIKQAILRHKTRLNAEFTKVKIKRGIKANVQLAQTEDVRACNIPRYVRVNTLKWTVEEAIQSYLKRGFTMGDPFSSDSAFAKDDHVPDLLKFPPQMSFHDDDFYKTGRIILQDKASCFPVIVLVPPARDDAVVIDATAAPGNKTSHLSAIMRNRGKLYAMERDHMRFSTLTKMLAKAGCSNVTAMNADFLSLDPQDPQYAKTTHILLDPSCSGSGIINRLDYLLEADSGLRTDEGRLNKLASFQLTMIKHAMKFPHVKRILYSTCSIHATENEHVVSNALKSSEAKDFVLAAPDDVLPNWPRRGLPGELEPSSYANSLVRCLPGEDMTNGFFVSCFVRGNGENPLKRASVTESGEGHRSGLTIPRRKNRKRRKLNPS